MKSRRRRVPFGESVDPPAFDYTLMSNLYIHDDGNDVIDFADYATRLESSHEVRTLLRNRSFMASSVMGGAAASAAREAMGGGGNMSASAGSALLHLHGDEESDGEEDGKSRSVAGGVTGPTRLRRSFSRLVSVDDASAHLWLVAQASEERPPYARMFTSPESLLAYASSRGMELPVRGQRRRTDGGGSGKLPTSRSEANVASLSPTRNDAGAEVPFPMPQSRREQGPLPMAKWIDIQADLSEPSARESLRRLLHHFPLDEATIDNCLYLSPHDYADTTHLSSRLGGYTFVILTCTPLQGLDYSAAPDGAENPQTSREHVGHHGGRRDGAAEASAAANHNAVHTKSVMEMRLEAVRMNLPRSAVPAPVPVAVVAFADWIITVHEKPFAEMDDLLRSVQLHCSPRPETRSPLGGQHGVPDALHSMHAVAATGPAVAQQRMTVAFIFTSLLQISIGHHIDSVALAQAVDELGDVVFDIKRTQREQDKVLERITAVRRCFGECGADATRCEKVVTSLLQPSLAHNFLLREPGTREKLLTAQAHIRYVQHELSDCRDTVAVSTWYHNVAVQWIVLRRGSRALHQILQLTEMANIMYPIITIQTLYSMNVPVPFQVDGNPPCPSLVPFFVVLVAILLYCLFCAPAVRGMVRRKRFETKLLA